MTIDEAKTKFEDYDIKEALKSDEPHDIIHEIADSSVDVYTSELLKWVGEAENYQFVEDAIDEFGFPQADGKPDFIKAIMQGQYKANSDILWLAWEELKK